MAQIVPVAGIGLITGQGPDAIVFPGGSAPTTVVRPTDAIALKVNGVYPE